MEIMYRTKIFAVLMLVLLLTLLPACGGKKALSTSGLLGQKTVSRTVEGLLAEARCFHTTGANGANHEFCAFVAAQSNLPVGIQTDEGGFVYLAVQSRRLAKLVNQRLRVQGPVKWNGTLLLPQRIWRRENGGWHEVALNRDDG